MNRTAHSFWIAGLALSLGTAASAQAPKPAPKPAAKPAIKPAAKPALAPVGATASPTTPASPAAPVSGKILVPNSPEAAAVLDQIRGGTGNIASPATGTATPGAETATLAMPRTSAGNPPGTAGAGVNPLVRPMLVPVGPNGMLGEPAAVPGLPNGLPAREITAGNAPAANAPSPRMEGFAPSGLPDGGALTEGGAPVNAPPSASIPPFFATMTPAEPEPPTPVPVKELSILYSVVILLAVGYFGYTARTAPQEEGG